MSRTRVYIKPFNDLGVYTEFIEVTDDVDISGLASIKRGIDSTEYDVGVFKFSSFSIKLANETGRYSDVDVFQSIFRYKRNDSIIKITWNPNADDDAIAGVYIGSDDITIFEGLLRDEASKLNIRDQKINFQCLGYDALFDRMEVPFSSLSPGDTFEEILLACTDQAPFNELVTVSASNISVDTNSVTDAVAGLENETVKEALDVILLHSNSILYIDDNVLYIVTRAESASSQYTFYGQASNDGIENIIDMKNIRSGVNRVFNLLTWDDSTESAFDATSQAFYGVRKKAIETDMITNTGKRSTILTNIKDEFKDAKQELNLSTSMEVDRLGLGVLNKVNIDYPTVFVPADENDLPLWGKVRWGEFLWPIGQWSLTISPTTDYKILQINYNLKRRQIILKLREV